MMTLKPSRDTLATLLSTLETRLSRRSLASNRVALARCRAIQEGLRDNREGLHFTIVYRLASPDDPDHDGQEFDRRVIQLPSDTPANPRLDSLVSELELWLSSRRKQPGLLGLLRSLESALG